MNIVVKMNLFHLRYYEILIGVDWLASHQRKFDYYNNALEFLSDEGEDRTLQGNKRPIILKQIVELQVEHCNRKGFTFFVVHVTE